MNERYLFRGKRIDNGEWVAGLLLSISDTRYAITEEHLKLCRKNEFIPIEKKRGTADIYYLEVDPATLGQCTGLNDKNGKLIFEGDVVTDSKTRSYSEGYTGVVEWEGSIKPFQTCAYRVELWAKRRVNSYKRQLSHHESQRFTIVGNIFDNPELLEK